MGDQVPGRSENVGGGAVVALQPDHDRARKIFLEAQDVIHFGAAPAIDGLVVVAHAAHVARAVLPGALGQQAQPQILGDVGILIFVDEDVAEAPVILVEHAGVVLEDLDRVHQQVAEIGRVQLAEPLLVRLVEQAALAVAEGAGVTLGYAVGRQRLVLPAIHEVGEGARRPALVIEVLGLDELLDEPDLVVGVEDGEIRLQPHKLGVAAQDAHADGVEGAKPRHAFDFLADQHADARLHLARGLVGEGLGEDLGGVGAPGRQDMGDPRRQHARLAGSGTGQHQYGPFRRFHGCALLWIEPGHIGRFLRGGCARTHAG